MRGGEAAAAAALTTRPWTLMEVCGGQTHAIVRWCLDQLLPPGLRLIHGPGCPVCVTPAATIDAALELARTHPDQQVVFLAVGFETTAPATALLARQARVPPAMEAILTSPDPLAPGDRVQGFLAAGHVAAVVVTGFEPADLLRGLEAGRSGLENAYGRVVRAAGNPQAQALLQEVFKVVGSALARPRGDPWRRAGSGAGVRRAGCAAALRA